MMADPNAAVDAGPSGRRRFLRRVACAVAAFAAWAAAGPPPAAADIGQPRVFELRIENRAVAGVADRVIRVSEGDDVDLRWRTDEAVVIHLHGYDLTARLKPGTAASMRFRARATGRFPVSSHGFEGAGKEAAGHGHKALLYLEVHPR